MDNSNRKSRLMITKMVLENFKSYAGIQEIGPFHKRFSSVVGPNGSGKSNVIDALLFVFGKRAAQLRLKNVSELIHKSSRYPNLEYAKVSVHFQLIYDIEDSDDGYETVDNSQFVITRTATKSNQSKYYVDEITSTFTDVGVILTKHGIDLDNNRFLILQGEVEQIAMMKPKGATTNDVGLLEYLEDIIGSNKFVERIEAALKALDEANEVRTSNVNRLKVAEKERDNLSGSKKEAEDFMALESRIREEKNRLYQANEHTANENTAQFTARKEKAEAKLAHEKNKLVESEAKLAAFQRDYEAGNTEYNSVKSEMQKSTLEYDAFQRRDVKIQEDMKYSRTQIKKHQSTVEKEAAVEKKSLEAVEAAHSDIEKYGQAVSDFTRKKNEEEAKLDAIMQGLKGDTEVLRASLDIAQSQLAEAEKGVATLQTEKENTLTAIQLLQSRSEENTKRLNAAKEKLANLLTEREAAQKRIQNMEGQGQADLAQKVRALEDTIRHCEEQETYFLGAVSAAIRAAEEAKASLTSQQTSKGGVNAVVEKILQATKKNGPLSKVKGIKGRLGDLGSISPEFDAAVSTASGQFDSIVVDDNEAAQACVAFLKENNLGRASFMMTSQMEEWRVKMSRPITTPEGAPRLFDLVQVSDPSIAPSFYLALRDTLVVPDLDTAVRIAYVGNKAVWRVVTQDGNLIDTSGTMSGGGRVAKTGSMKLSTGAAKSSRNNLADAEEDITPAQVAALEKQVVTLQAQQKENRELRQAAEKDLKEARKALSGITNEVEKSRLLIARYNEQEGELHARIAELSTQTALTPEEQADIQRQSAFLAEIEGKMGDISPFQREVASLQRQIRSVGGPTLVAAQQRVDSMSAQLEKVSSQLSTKQVEQTSAAKQAEKSSVSRAKAEMELQKAQEKLQLLVAEQNEMENDALAVVTALEATKERLAEMEDSMKHISAEFHELKAAVAKIKTVEIDLGVEVERILGEIKESSDIAKRYRKESAAVRKQHIDEQREFDAVIKSVVMPPHPSTLKAATAVETPDEDAMDVDDAKDSADSSVNELPIFTAEQLAEVDVQEVTRSISLMEAEKNKLKSSVNMSALLEYLKKDANYKSRLYELEVITEERNRVRREYEDLRRQRLESFMAGFGVISLKLKEMYQMITLGGDAELELLDSLDPFSEGIVFSVRPPKKSWKNISNLSGGEKTLSSLALVFALHHYKPTPLYVMDEIDAALDFKNVSIVANYIKDRTKDAQFIIISLRNNMFELADRLVGIYKTNDATKSVTINPKMFEGATAGIKPEVTKAEGGASTAPLGDVTNTKR